MGWKNEKLGNTMKLEYGFSLSDKWRIPGPYPVYGSSGVVAHHANKRVNGPGIVVGRKGTIGSVAWSHQDYWPIDTTYFVVTTPNYDLKWFYFELQFLKLNKLNTASGVPGLNREEVHKLTILIPPKKEQEKIAEVLSAVDEDIEKTDSVIAKTEKLKKGLMQELLGKVSAIEKKTENWQRFDRRGFKKLVGQWNISGIQTISAIT